MLLAGFEASLLFLIVLGLGFVAMIIATVVRMTRKKGARKTGAGRGRGRPDESADEDDDLPDPDASAARRSREDRAGRTPGKAAATSMDTQASTRPSVQPGKQGKTVEPARAKPAEPSFKVDIEKARHMTEGLARTRKEGFVARLAETFGRGGELDQTLVAGAEEALLTADIGVRTAMELTEGLRNDFKPSGNDLVPQVMAFLRDRTLTMLQGQRHGLPSLDAPGLNVVMVVGVNGTGKTTNIAKLANWYAARGRKVLLAAGDTYRAAGADQLGIWGERIGVPVVVGKPGQDPSSLFFDAARRAVAEGFDILIADTAGRLHTDVNLVDELKKVHRVFGKAVPGAPHEVLLMLDATMGQNAVRQADVFLNSVKVTGIGLAKLDGTAKGGVVVSIARDMNLPVWFVGVGEAVTDIRSFDASEFVDALYSID